MCYFKNYLIILFEQYAECPAYFLALEEGIKKLLR